MEVEILEFINNQDTIIKSCSSDKGCTPENAPGMGLEMGDPFSKIYTKHPGWKDIISTAKKQPGSNLKHYD